MSKDRKKEAIALLAKGATQAQVARSLSISRQAVSLWLKSETFRDEVQKARKDFLATQNEHEKLELNSLVEKIPIPISEPITTFKSVLRQQEIDLLSKIELNLLPQLLEGGGVRVASVLLKLSERRSKLLGLDLKPYDVLEAFQVLVSEQCADPFQMRVVSDGLDQIKKQLKCVTDVTRAIEE
ncbi:MULTISPECIES: helix-turn-helix domain-containing protein [Nostoc]|uniref:Uncharacterized protein n=2 Tax=Nostoc TaxID=1177 RepID=A0ABR8II84_9NOSO|nr:MULTISPECIES: helix-turn-helix domain-containing protein [Nostoc]MBD2560492.1 hypothetical protein [Nostoc linckia FACHB-391]MBD2651294.1 hypothetical protein [Nostoc foliaceum FACHB-393]